MNDKGQKLCPQCHVYKNIENFGRKKGRKSGGPKISSWCKKCCSKINSDRRRKNGRSKTPLGFRIQRMLTNMCKFDSQIKTKFLRELYTKQNGLCFYSGVQMKLISDLKSDPLIMSVDKINPEYGYIKDNVVLCCLALNHLKGRHSVEKMYESLKILSDGARNIGKI